MKYERIKYPDGQLSAKITDFSDPTINERINSYEDLMFVKSLAEIMNYRTEEVHLEIPCLFGQRSDMRFHPHQSFDLKIIAEIINSCNFASVKLFDPHSAVAAGMINKCTVTPPDSFITSTISALENGKGWGKDITLISPDAGAYKKVYKLADKLHVPMVGAVKCRTEEGIHISMTDNVNGLRCLIIDDLCDGGYTFTSLASQLRGQGAREIYLYVSHGYFSKGFTELKKNIKHIFCTNSVKDIEDEFVTQYRVI